MRRNVLYQYMYVLIKNIRAFNLTLSGQAPRPGGTRLQDAWLAVLVNMGAELAEAGHAVFFVLRERPENIPWRSALPASVPLLIWRGNELEHTVPDRRPPALRPEDIWLLPEGWPLALLPGLRAGARVVLYVQNWAYLLAELPDGLKLPALPVRYLAVSRPVAWHVRDMTGKTAELLRPGLDFRSGKRR